MLGFQFPILFFFEGPHNTFYKDIIRWRYRQGMK
jgi:hypothetical protein